jgi:hypothetical protein
MEYGLDKPFKRLYFCNNLANIGIWTMINLLVSRFESFNLSYIINDSV